ncbi:MAG: hypothetical protein HGA19_21270, partial [Oscillochloris sp.]|nr:hypothetical protein [Oscillochloris sp.]
MLLPSVTASQGYVRYAAHMPFIRTVQEERVMRHTRFGNFVGGAFGLSLGVVLVFGLLRWMGMPTGQGKTWTAHRVASVRRVRGIHAYRSAEKDGAWLTMTEAAAALGVTSHA